MYLERVEKNFWILVQINFCWFFYVLEGGELGVNIFDVGIEINLEYFVWKVDYFGWYCVLLFGQLFDSYVLGMFMILCSW